MRRGHHGIENLKKESYANSVMKGGGCGMAKWNGVKNEVKYSGGAINISFKRIEISYVI